MRRHVTDTTCAFRYEVSGVTNSNITIHRQALSCANLPGTPVVPYYRPYLKLALVVEFFVPQLEYLRSMTIRILV